MTNDQRPTTNDQRPTTNDHRPTTNDQRPTTNDQRPTTNDQRPTTNDQRPTTNDYLQEGPMSVLIRRVIHVAILTLAVAPPAALAQSVSASVAGTVVDQTRQVIPGANVTLISELTSDMRATTTNEAGVFVFSALRPGTYTVRVELTGFTTFERKNTVVPANEQLSVGAIQLNVGSLSERSEEHTSELQ